jgi:large subunit ribosomal protein L18
MKSAIKIKRNKAALRVHRTRIRIKGTATCPRLSVKRSLKHIYAQLIDDVASRTLISASDAQIEKKGKPLEVAQEVGKTLASRAKAAGIERAVFDRGQYRYHGRVAALAQGAREAGLQI